MKSIQKQQSISGATLAMVLLFLLILTILGIASMSDSIIQQKSSTNVYLENEAFHVSESAISAAIYHDEITGESLYGTQLDQLEEGQDYCVGDNGALTTIDSGADCTALFEGNANIVSFARVEYLGCGTCPNFELGVASGIGCNAWKVTGDTTIAEKTKSTVESWVIKVGGCFNSSQNLNITL